MEREARARRPVIFYGWIIVAISLVTLTIAYATRFSFSVFYVAILNEFGWSRAETALAFSINLIVYALLSPISGALIDRFGPRVVFPAGAVICGLGLLGLSQLSGIWQLYLFSGLLAVGISLIGYITHSALLANWFSLKLGTAIGFAVIGMALGNTSSLPIQQLINITDWRQAYLVLAFIVVGLIVPLTAVFQRHHARDMRLPMDGIAGYEVNPGSDGKITDRPDPRVVNHEWAAIEWTLPKAMKTDKFWLLFMQTFSSGIAFNLILVHTVALIVDLGYSKILAASIFSLIGGLALVSGLGGYISDRIGRELTYTLGVLGMCVGLFALLMVRDTSSPWLLYVFAVFFGSCQGALRPLTMVAKADVFKGKHMGTIMGANNLSYGTGGAIGAWLGGYLFDISNSYTLAFSLTIPLLTIASAFLWAAAPRKIRVVGGKISKQPT
ncbi:MAG: MFS transporter [Dehalococcoidales bacterium]|nr:MFS transporter [Dehalococcoidales bacterium]